MSNIDKMTEEQYHLELARMYRSGYEDGKKDEELRARRAAEKDKPECDDRSRESLREFMEAARKKGPNIPPVGWTHVAVDW